MGFKPTYGVMPRTAMLKTTDTLDTVGIMARSVEDVKLAFDVMSGTRTQLSFSL